MTVTKACCDEPIGAPCPCAAKAAIATLVEEFRAANESADPRAVDVLMDAINCSLREFGLEINDGKV